uniref:Adenosine deaminase domain-containing protein n=1 Tax=Megaselia scalaris TaxID=36166 RepID=T1GYN8_MEGSC
MSKSQYLETILSGIIKASKLYPTILVKLLPSIDRSHGLKAGEETISIVLESLKNEEFKNIIKGIDFSGNPEKGKFYEFKDLLNKCRNSGLQLAVHCGEIRNPCEIRDMLEFGMDRCGHGTFINDHNLENLMKKNIPIECCLSSNVACGTVKDFNEHHFHQFFTRKHPVVICTDDFGIFSSNLSSELIIAANTFSLTKTDILTLCLNAINASFASLDEKKCLRKKINYYFK